MENKQQQNSNHDNEDSDRKSIAKNELEREVKNNADISDEDKNDARGADSAFYK